MLQTDMRLLFFCASFQNKDSQDSLDLDVTKKKKNILPTLSATCFQNPFCQEANAIRRGRVLCTVKLYTQTGGKHAAGVTQTSSGSLDLMLKCRGNGDLFPTKMDFCISLISPSSPKIHPLNGRVHVRFRLEER